MIAATLRRRARGLPLRAQRPRRRLAVLRGQAGLVRPARALAGRGGRRPTSRSCSAATSTSRPRTPTSGTRAPATAAPTSRRRSGRPSRGCCDWGLVDAYRLHHPEPGRYTWWDYRAGNFHKNFGMRIDHLLVTRAAGRRTVWAEIDREARKGKPIPSDHAPLVIDVDAPGPPVRRRLGLGRGPHRRAAPEGLMAFPLEPPIEPMLAKLADELPPGDGWLFEPKWDGFRAIVFRDGDERLHPEPRPEAARPLLPGAGGAAAGAPARALRRRRRDRDRRRRAASTSTRCSCGSTRRPRAWRSWRRRRRRRSSPSTSWRRATATCARSRRPSAARALEQALPRRRGRVHLTPCSRDRARRRRTGSIASRAPGSTASSPSTRRRPTSPASARWSRSSTSRTADCVVAGFRWHKNGPGTLVGSLLLGLYDDGGRAAPRRRDVVVHDGGAPAARRGAAPLREDALGAPPWREWAEADGRPDAHAGRAEPLERGQGPLVGAAAHRARVRGEVRPPAGRPLPARGRLPALAAGQAARGLPLRPARGHAARGARGVFGPASLPFAVAAPGLGALAPPGAAPLRDAAVPGVVVGSSGSWAGRSSSGTCSRFTRTRVQVDERPRIESTSTSAGWRCGPPRDAAPSTARDRPAPPLSSAPGRSRRGASSRRGGRPGLAERCRPSRDGATRGGSPGCLA